MRYLFALIALGLLLALHELGHLVAARLLRVRVNRYIFGFGPPLGAFKLFGIRFVVGAIPLGGSVKLHGANPHDEKLSDADETGFLSQRPWKRLLILASGSFANFLLALVVLVALYMHGTHVPVPLTVGTVEPGSPAARAQLRPGDVIESLDGARLTSWSELIDRISDRVGERLSMTIVREGQTVTTQIEPRSDIWGQGRIGVAEQYVYREHAFGPALGLAFGHLGSLITGGARMLGRVAQGKSGLPLLAPTTLARQASEAAASGLDAFLRLLTGISVALAVFHLLPLPALDGGRMALTALEWARGKRLNEKLETLIHAVGFALLMAGVVFLATAALRDLLRSQRPSTNGHELPIPARLRGSDAGLGPEEEEELENTAGPR